MKIGLMLGGGGAKGSYQLGILKAFEELGLISHINAISGASIGALNSYFYLSSNGIDDVVNAWAYGTKNNPFKVEMASKDKKLSEEAFKIVKDMAEKYTDETIFKASKTDLFVIVTEIEKPNIFKLIRRRTWKEHVIHLNKEENPLDYVISSSTIPVILGFSEMDDKTYIDGGFINNNPVDVLIEQGCELIFVSSLDYFYTIDRIKDYNVTLVDLTSKEAMPSNVVKSMLSIIDFKEEVFKKRMQYGYFVAKKMVKYIMEIGILRKDGKNYQVCDLSNAIKRVHIPKQIDDALKEFKESQKD